MVAAIPKQAVQSVSWLEGLNPMTPDNNILVPAFAPLSELGKSTSIGLGNHATHDTKIASAVKSLTQPRRLTRTANSDTYQMRSRPLRRQHRTQPMPRDPILITM